MAYLDTIISGQNEYDIYSQGITDGSGGSANIYNFSRLTGALIVTVPSTGWNEDESGWYTITIALSQVDQYRITSSTLKSAYCYCEDTSTKQAMNNWLNQKKSFSKFAKTGTIVTGEGKLILYTKNVPTYSFKLAIPGV